MHNSPELSSDGLSLKTYSELDAAIFKPECLGCHGAGDTNIDFTSHASLVASPKFSQLYSSVASGQMPLGLSPLSSNEVAAILAWVQKGAPNE